METVLTKAEKQRIAKSCKKNPYKMFNVLEAICKELQLMDISTFAEKSTKSKRTIYNMVSDIEYADMEFLQICDQKFIPAVLNKDILK